jgi:hypothetical protein
VKQKNFIIGSNVHQIEVVNLVENETPHVRSENVIAVGNHIDSKEVLDFAIDHKMRQIVQGSSLSIDREMKTAALMIAEPETFLNCPVASILALPIVTPEAEKNCRKVDIQFERRTEMQLVLGELESALKSMNLNLSLIDDVLLVAGELCTNSLYNAPYVDIEKVQSGISRRISDDDSKLDRPGRLFMGNDENCLVVGCEDLYGTLNVTRSFEQVRKCFVQGAHQVIDLDGEAGAGIGSYLIHKIATGFYAGVRENEKTIVCCSFPLRVGNLKRASMPKNLHFFQLPTK